MIKYMLTLSSAIAATLLVPSLASASIPKDLSYHTVPTQEKIILDKVPVLSVRFNKDSKSIHYREMLDKVVNKVSSIKSDTRYDIVSVVPVAKGETKKKKIKEASQNTRKMFFALKDAGIDPQNIAVHYQENASAPNNEIHVFIH